MDPNQQNQNPDQNPNSGPQQSDIAEKAAERRQPLMDPTGRVEHLTSEETLIFDVRRHPFGLFVIYVQFFIALGLSLVLIFALLPSAIDALGVNRNDANAVASLFGLIVVVFGFLFLILATRIYKGNQLIVSDKNVTQVLQVGLFDRKVSELSMGNIEDVTARQRGVFPTIFNYGLLTVETAGEQNNFIFPYCPNPNAYAKAILDARLQYMNRGGSRH
jgi:uncharacterized membrane protein YdbT with pleckstrin-like domain